jgi:DHA1 family multidrug resistance protein-like MFS transporter/DHA1 family quinolone resistance protein-like MFS transporter
MIQPRKLWQSFYNQRSFIRSFYSGIGKTAVILPTAFLAITALGLVTFSMIFLLRDFYHASPSQIGWFSACWSFSYVCGCLFIRPLFSRMLPRYSIVLASFLLGAFSLAIVLGPSLEVAFLLYALCGVSLALLFPPIMGWLSHRKEAAELNRAISRFNLSWSMAMIFSPLIAGFLTEKSPKVAMGIGSLIFLTTSLLVLCASLTIPRLRKDRHREAVEREQPGEDRSTPLRFPAWVGAFTSYIAMGVLLNIFPLFAREVLLIRESRIGLLLLMRALFSTIGFLFLGRYDFWHFRGWQILITQLCVAIIVLSMVFARSFAVFLLLFPLFGLVSSLSYQNSIFHGVSGSKARARRMAVHEANLHFGMVVGAGAGGLIYQSTSIELVFVLCVVVVLMGMGASAILMKPRS